MSPAIVGYAAALGIELAVVGVSLQIGRRKSDNRDAGFFDFVLISVVVVSALANVAQGHLQRYGQQITWETMTAIDVVQGVIGLAATALLSLIVMAMAEIVGQFMEQDWRNSDATDDNVGAQFDTKTEHVQELARNNPGMSVRQLANVAQCSVSLARRALKNDNEGPST